MYIAHRKKPKPKGRGRGDSGASATSKGGADIKKVRNVKRNKEKEDPRREADRWRPTAKADRHNGLRPTAKNAC